MALEESLVSSYSKGDYLEIELAGGRALTGTIVGLDQANAELLRELAGRGDVELQLQVEGRATNTVRLRFR